MGKFLQEIDPTPGERTAVVETAVTNRVLQQLWQKGVKREDIDRVREWVAKKAPGSEDHAAAAPFTYR